MLLVEIEKPETVTLAAWFSELRDWLDLNRYEPTIFTQSARPADRLIYRISFENAAQAQQFAARFASYAPVIRNSGRVRSEAGPAARAEAVL